VASRSSALVTALYVTKIKKSVKVYE